MCLAAFGDLFGGYAHVNAIRFCASCYHGAGADDAAARDADSIQNAGVRAYPNVILDDDAVAVASLTSD